MSNMEITDTFQSEERDEICTHIDGSEIQLENGPYGKIMFLHKDFEKVIAQYQAFKRSIAA